MATIPIQDDDVEQQLTKLMSKNSGLMKQARTQGLSSAQNMGLGQSTAGIRAAQAAAYQAAVPLASQAAQQGQQTKMQGAQFGHEVGMQGAEFGQQTKMQQAGFGQETQMQRELFGQQTGLQRAQFGHENTTLAAQQQQATHQANLDRAHQVALTNQQGYLDRLKMNEGAGLERGTLAITQAHEANMAAQERASKEWLANIDMSNANKERAAASLSAANQTYAQGVAGIMNNPNLPADVRNSLLQQQEGIRAHNYNVTRSLYQNF